MKQMIWSSYDLLDETAKEEYQNSQREILDDDSYEVSDEEWAEEVYCRLDDERSNLNKEVDGIIEHKVEYPGDLATIQYDPKKTNPDAIIKVIEQTGYKAEIIKENQKEKSL